jgi:hypothetical protein
MGSSSSAIAIQLRQRDEAANAALNNRMIHSLPE